MSPPPLGGMQNNARISDVQAQVDALGFGWYQYLLIFTVGVSSLVESMEMGTVAPLHTALARAFGLSRQQRTLLPTFTYLGAMAGMVVAGPLADLWGRKRALALALVMICIVNCLHAVLPLGTSFGVIVVLRIFTGVAGAIGIPTGISLAVESCPQRERLWMVFAITFLGSLGYLIEAVGVEAFMPHFGEEDTDNWRGLCLFCGIPALASLPFVYFLGESPTLLAINGSYIECLESLGTIARWNGQPPPGSRPQSSSRRRSTLWRSLTVAETRGTTLWRLAADFLPILVLLVLVDSLRSFFTSGSAYLCKDLFELTRLNDSISPTGLNVIASISPLVGLIIGERLSGFGVKTIMFGSSLIAAGSMVALAFPVVRSISLLLLILVLAYKLTYGPMVTCLALMKVESFPTEFRATAFAAICVAGKLLCALGPTLVEALKKDESASSWDPRNLAGYLFSLAGAVFLSGVLALRVPVASCTSEGTPLQDFSECSLENDDKSSLNADKGVAYGTNKESKEGKLQA